MSIECPCRVCNLEVKNDDESIQRDLRDKWNHKKYEKLKNDPLPWYCSFYKSSSIKRMCEKTREIMKRFCQMNQVFDDNENAINFDYYIIDELNKLNINRHHDLFILNLNISSLSSHIDDIKIFLSLLTAKVDILCISESRLSQNNPVTTNLHIPVYTFEHTPTE